MSTARFCAGFCAPEIVSEINALAKRYPVLEDEPAMWHALVGICRLRPAAMKRPLPAQALGPQDERQVRMFLSNTQDGDLKQVAEKLDLFREMADIMRDRLHKPAHVVEAYEAGYGLLLRVSAHIVADARRSPSSHAGQRK